MNQLSISDINFKGNFINNTCICKRAKKGRFLLEKLLQAECAGLTNQDFLKTLPFDAYIYSKPITSKAINPKFSFFISTNDSPERAGMLALKHIKYNDKNPELILRDFILNFKKAFEENTTSPLKGREQDAQLAEMILLGRFNSKK